MLGPLVRSSVLKGCPVDASDQLDVNDRAGTGKHQTIKNPESQNVPTKLSKVSHVRQKYHEPKASMRHDSRCLASHSSKNSVGYQDTIGKARVSKVLSIMHGISNTSKEVRRHFAFGSTENAARRQWQLQLGESVYVL